MNMQHESRSAEEQTSLDQCAALIRETLATAQALGPVTNLAAHQALAQAHTTLRTESAWLLKQWRDLEQEIQRLPDLPNLHEVQWAQRTLADPTLTFLEVDTTGLEESDEIVRVTLLDGAGQIQEDWLLAPLARTLSEQASFVNGLTDAQLQGAPALEDIWQHLAQRLLGRKVISFGLEWDLRQLQRAAQVNMLPVIRVKGECLRQHATWYYHNEYGLKLADLCARVGSPLTDYPQQTSRDRARGQRAVLLAMAQGITAIRPTFTSTTSTGEPTPSLPGDDFDPFEDESADLP